MSEGTRSMEIRQLPLASLQASGPCVMALGIFDGVHLGHQRLLASVHEQARRQDCPAVVVTFDPHPAVLLAPGGPPRLLMTLEDRLKAFEDAGMGLAWVVPFSRAFSELEPLGFLAQLHQALRPAALHVGRGFRFGRDRSGSVDTLREWGRTVSCDVQAHAFRAPGGSPLSSTLVRQALDRGDPEEARQLLGRPFILSGVVEEGDRRGRHLGYPTLNLAWEQEQLPARGVYLTEVRCSHFPGPRPGLTNIGEKPTFAGLRTTVETYLPGFEGDLYGTRVELGFCHRIRAERVFPGARELVEQIASDVAQGLALWESHGNRNAAGPASVVARATTG